MVSLRNFTGVSVALLPNCRAIGYIWSPAAYFIRGLYSSFGKPSLKCIGGFDEFGLTEKNRPLLASKIREISLQDIFPLSGMRPEVWTNIWLSPSLIPNDHARRSWRRFVNVIFMTTSSIHQAGAASTSVKCDQSWHIEGWSKWPIFPWKYFQISYWMFWGYKPVVVDFVSPTETKRIVNIFLNVSMFMLLTKISLPVI